MQCQGATSAAQTKLSPKLQTQKAGTRRRISSEKAMMLTMAIHAQLSK